jgi:hypothetical protein
MKPIGALISSCALTGLLTAQPRLRITSPTDGTTVYRGDTLTVTVDVSPPAAFGLVFVAGGDPVGFSKEKLDKPPYRFTLQIPRSTRPDKYPIAAAGFTSINRELLNSHSITVLVERADSPVSLTVYPVIADFTMDQKRYFPVTAFTPIKQRPPYGQEKRPSPTTPQDRGSGSCPGAREVTCSYPLHSSTGNLGYFGKLESTFESWQR